MAIQDEQLVCLHISQRARKRPCEHHAVQTVSASQKTASATITRASHTVTILHDIQARLGCILEMNSQIARATIEQSQAANEANLRINELASMSDESLRNSLLVSEIGNILNNNSGQMSAAIKRFKLN